MSKPLTDENLRQLAIWLPEELKAELKNRARHEGKLERDVVTEALTAHLRAAVEKPTHRK